MAGGFVATAALMVLVCCFTRASPSGAALSSYHPRVPKDSPHGNLLRERLHAPSIGPEDPLPPLDEVNAEALCLECQLVITALKAEVELGLTYDQLKQEAIDVCLGVLNFTQPICDGYINLFAPMIYYIFTNDPIIPSDVCGILFNGYGCNTTQPSREWIVDIHGEKPPVVPIVLPDPGQPTMKVLHISDMHMDPLYLPGSNADCRQEFCCRNDSGVPATPESEAWFWGDYRYCGSPPWLMEDMLAHIRREHTDLSYVMWTGDVVPHNMWSTTREWNVRVIKETNKMIQDYFPDIPVFPVIGNHEHSPLNQYPDPNNCPEEFCADWLYEALADQWASVIPGLDVSTVLYAGFYSVPVTPGFRIISVNSMFGYTGDFWLYENSNDVAHELAWLENELGKAEEAGELVHLLGHIPPGLLYNDRTWSREYSRIIVRYENTIRGQFFGHTHFDEFEVFHDGDRPMGVAYVAPSQTPWYYLNPAYRIYTVDGERPETTRVVLDHTTYITNLTEAHETNATRWYKLYSAKEAYGMADLSPESWQQMALRMADDRELFDIYWRNYVSVGDPFLEEGCDDVCYEQKLCDVMTGNRNDLDACYGAIQRKRRASRPSA